MVMEPNLTGNDSSQTVSTGDALFFNVSVNIWPSSRAVVSVRITVGPRFSDILGGKVFLSLNRGVTKSGSNTINFLYRGKFILSLNRGVTKSGCH